MFEDIEIKKRKKDEIIIPTSYIKEIDLSKKVTNLNAPGMWVAHKGCIKKEFKMSLHDNELPMGYSYTYTELKAPSHDHSDYISHQHKLNKVHIDNNIYYGDINLGTPEKINKVLNITLNQKKEINKLANFLLKNYEYKICGSAVDTAIDILSNVKSIEYNNSCKEEYKDGVIVAANGVK